jgi:L-amino acid N-acyltransferase YncA
MSEIAIRPAREADVPAIAAIYGRSVEVETASWEYEPPTLAEMQRRFADIVAKGFPYLVAEHEGRTVGYSYASSYRARVGYRFVVEDSVYVAHEMKGRGIGRLLLHALIGKCAEQGYKQMIAVIGDSENAASIKLHEACGFQHVALFKNIGYKFDRWLDSVQMQRSLG